MTDADLNQAVVIFLGFGTASWPQQDHARLVQEFGAIRGAELQRLVSQLLDELGKIEVDWSVHSWQSGTDLARQTMHARHPELSDAALDALAWKFSYDWR